MTSVAILFCSPSPEAQWITNPTTPYSNANDLARMLRSMFCAVSFFMCGDDFKSYDAIAASPIPAFDRTISLWTPRRAADGKTAATITRVPCKTFGDFFAASGWSASPKDSRILETATKA